MSRNEEIAHILSQVSPWPEEDRVALAYQILRHFRKQIQQPAPRDTADSALGLAAGATPPPDDATVKQWIDEHRMQKYG